MFEKYVRNNIGGGPFFFKAVDLKCYFFICYISIFLWGGGGELLTCTVHF